MKVLIDTCVIIDALQNREPFSKNAQDIFLLAANRRIDAFITAKSVTDIYYLMHRVTHSDKDTRNVLSRLFVLFGLADTVGTDCRYALSSEVSDYEDAVMIETAARTQMDAIVTRNTKDYSKSAVPVLTPEELIQKISEETEEE
ncbi:MAG: PIN domain-containing protein [Ruminococcus sp.]|nr:PIN domain-containing protein [Ruminococcus sp.]